MRKVCWSGVAQKPVLASIACPSPTPSSSLRYGLLWHYRDREGSVLSFAAAFASSLAGKGFLAFPDIKRRAEALQKPEGACAN